MEGLLGKYIAAILGTWEFENSLVFGPVFPMNFRWNSAESYKNNINGMEATVIPKNCKGLKMVNSNTKVDTYSRQMCCTVLGTCEF